MKENLVKIALVFGGGYLLYWLIRSAKENYKSKPATNTNTQSFAGKANPEDAKIVMKAYKMAKANNEPASRLSELNKECIAEFGMRCYVDESGKTVVCDVNGNTIISE